jgi:hypothetical protein
MYVRMCVRHGVFAHCGWCLWCRFRGDHRVTLVTEKTFNERALPPGFWPPDWTPKEDHEAAAQQEEDGDDGAAQQNEEGDDGAMDTAPATSGATAEVLPAGIPAPSTTEGLPCVQDITAAPSTVIAPANVASSTLTATANEGTTEGTPAGDVAATTEGTTEGTLPGDDAPPSTEVPSSQASHLPPASEILCVPLPEQTDPAMVEKDYQNGLAAAALLSPLPDHVTVPLHQDSTEETPITRMLQSDWFRKTHPVDDVGSPGVGSPGVGCPAAVVGGNAVVFTPNPPLATTNVPFFTGNHRVAGTTLVSPRRSPRGHDTSSALIQKRRKEDVLFARYMDARFPSRLSSHHERKRAVGEEVQLSDCTKSEVVQAEVAARESDQSCEYCKLLCRLGMRQKRAARTSIQCRECNCYLCSGHWVPWHTETIADWGERPRKWSTVVDQVATTVFGVLT